jgi:hypothetical protein
MIQKIFNNLILIIIILFFLKQMSPEPDSTLYILKKHLNYIIYQIRKLLSGIGFGEAEEFINTFFGIKNFRAVAPSFKTTYEIDYINYFIKINPSVKEKDIFDLYYFLQNLVSKNYQNSFINPSDKTENEFTDDEKEKIKLIIMKKLSSKYNFTDFNFEYYPKYYNNANGREIDPFIFTVNCIYGKIRIYINIDIRNDLYPGKEYLVINELKPLKDKHIRFSEENAVKYFSNEFNGDQDLVFKEFQPQFVVEMNQQQIQDQIKNEQNLIQHQEIIDDTFIAYNNNMFNYDPVNNSQDSPTNDYFNYSQI